MANFEDSEDYIDWTQEEQSTPQTQEPSDSFDVLPELTSLDFLTDDPLPELPSLEELELDAMMDYGTEDRPASAVPAPEKREGGLIKGYSISDKEVIDIANKHGVGDNLDILRFITDMQGGDRTGEKSATIRDDAKRWLAKTAGRAGNEFLFGLPQLAYKKSNSDKLAKAIDEVTALAHERRSYANAALDFIIPQVGVRKALGTIAGKAATKVSAKVGTEAAEVAVKAATPDVAKAVVPDLIEGGTKVMSEAEEVAVKQIAKDLKLTTTDKVIKAWKDHSVNIGKATAEGTGIGALSGLGHSEEEREWESMLTGAAAGAAFGGALGTMGSVINKRSAEHAESVREARIDIIEAVNTRRADGLDEKVHGRINNMADSIEAVFRDPSLLDVPVSGTTILRVKDDLLIPVNSIINTADDWADTAQKAVKALDSTLDDDAVNGQVWQREARLGVKKVIEKLTGEKVRINDTAGMKTHIQKLIKAGHSTEDLTGYYVSHSSSELLQKAILTAKEKAGIDGLDPAAISVLERKANKLSDAGFVMTGADRRYGTDITSDLMELSKNEYLASSHAFQQRKVLDKAKAVLVKDKVSNTELEQWLNKGQQPVGLSDKASTAFMSIRQVLDEVKELAKQRGAGIRTLDNYLRQAPVRGAEFILAMDVKKKELSEWLNVVTDGRIKALLDEDYSILSTRDKSKVDYLHALSMVTGREIRTADSMRRAISLSSNAKSVNQGLTRVRVGAAMAREGRIPEFIREKDVFKLVEGYVAGTLKQSYTKDAVRRLGEYIPMFNRAGDVYHSEYMKKLLESVVVPTDIVTETLRDIATSYKVATQRIAMRTNNSAARSVMETISTIPDVFAVLRDQMYPNLLGWNPKSALKNLVTPFTQTALDIGPEGERLMAHGLLETVKKIKAKGKAALEKELQDDGYLGGEFAENIGTLMQREQGGLSKLPLEKLETVNRIGMYLFQSAEIVNRSVVKEGAKKMAEEISAGSQKYNRWISALPVRIREKVQEQAARGEHAAIADYLIGRTMLMYTGSTASEFKRAVGPLLGAFTKFPSGAIGDLTDKIRTFGAVEGSAKAALKWLGPWVVAQQLNEMFDIDPEDMTDRQSLLMEKGKGLATYSPHDALTGYFSVPPIFKIAKGLMGAGKDLSKMGLEDFETAEAAKILAKRIGQPVTMYTPGAGILEMVAADLPTLLTGEPSEFWQYISGK